MAHLFPRVAKLASAAVVTPLCGAPVRDGGLVAPMRLAMVQRCGGIPVRRGKWGLHIAVFASVFGTAAFMGSPAAGAQAAPCDAPLQPMIEIEMMFGRNIAGRLGVSETAWSRFLAREFTPRFPDGLSVINAAGQWQDKRYGRIVREASKIVVIVTTEDAAVQGKIDAIAQAYKGKFHQQSVGIVVRPVCAAF